MRSYLGQRDEITRKEQKDEQARRLADLRTRSFGSATDIVREAEKTEFYRCGHYLVYRKE